MASKITTLYLAGLNCVLEKATHIFHSGMARLLAVHVRTHALSCGTNLSIGFPARGIMGLGNIRIGNNFVAGSGLKLRAFTEFKGKCYKPTIEIGNDVHFETDCHIGCINRICIGDGCLFASRVFITDHGHGCGNLQESCIPPLQRDLYSKGECVIGSNVWVGEGVVILPGVHIGGGSIIGANAVVTSDIPPLCVAAGVPARVIRHLESSTAAIGISYEHTIQHTLKHVQ